MKATGSFNTPVERWICTNSPKYHVDRFHTYINCPNKRGLDVSEHAKQSIQDYEQRTSMKAVIRGDQDIQVQRGQISSMAVCYMFAEQRYHLTWSCNEEGFGSLEHAIIMCEIMDPSTSRLVRLVCTGDLKVRYER